MESKTLKVVDKYTELVAFKEEVIEVSEYSFEYGFDDFKAKVKELLLYLDHKEVAQIRRRGRRSHRGR